MINFSSVVFKFAVEFSCGSCGQLQFNLILSKLKMCHSTNLWVFKSFSFLPIAKRILQYIVYSKIPLVFFVCSFKTGLDLRHGLLAIGLFWLHSVYILSHTLRLPKVTTHLQQAASLFISSFLHFTFNFPTFSCTTTLLAINNKFCFNKYPFYLISLNRIALCKYCILLNILVEII